MFKNLLAALLVLSFAGSAFAYELRDPKVYDFNDVQMWYSNGAGPQKLATGVCYGPFKEFVNDRGVKVGDLGRGCTMITYDSVNSKQDQSISGGMAVNLFSVMGLTGSVFQDPFNGQWKWGMGLSVLDVMKAVNGTKQLENTIPSGRADRMNSPVFGGADLGRSEIHAYVDQLDIDFVRIDR